MHTKNEDREKNKFDISKNSENHQHNMDKNILKIICDLKAITASYNRVSSLLLKKNIAPQKYKVSQALEPK